MTAIDGIGQRGQRDTMAAAYRAIHPLHPPYGEPLSAAVRQTFVDQVPTAFKAEVAAKLAKIQS